MGDIHRYETQPGSNQHGTTTSVLDVYRRLIHPLRTPPSDLNRLITLEKDPVLQTTVRHMADRVAFAQEVLNFHPDRLQQQALNSNCKRLILNCNRQWGKSTIAAIRALHKAWFWPDTTVLVLANAHPQAGELLQKVRNFLTNLNTECKGDGIHRHSLKLPNGSRIIALPGGEKPARSYTSSLVIIDEAAIVIDPVHESVGPTLGTTNGDMILISTPRGKRGAFYRAWAFGGESWERIFGPVDELSGNGRIALDHLAQERRDHTSDYYAQEYLCEFLDRDSHVFNEDQLRKVFRHDLETWEENH